jgi:hypothetical protein
MIVLKSGSLKLLETSGPVQACTRIDLPLPVKPTAMYTPPDVQSFRLYSLVADYVLTVFASDTHLVLVDSWQKGGRKSTLGTERKVSWAVSPTVHGNTSVVPVQWTGGWIRSRVVRTGDTDKHFLNTGVKDTLQFLQLFWGITASHTPGSTAHRDRLVLSSLFLLNRLSQKPVLLDSSLDAPKTV